MEDWAGLKTGEGWVKDVGELGDGWDSEAVDVWFTSMLKKSAVVEMAAVVGSGVEGACEEGLRGILDIESLGTERSGIGRGWREEGWNGGGVRNCTRERLEGREVDLMIAGG